MVSAFTTLLAQPLFITVEADMAQVSRSKVSLRVFGENLVPDEVSSLLHCQPTQSWCKGQVSSSGQHVRKNGAWFLRVEASEPENLDGQLASLFARMTSDPEAWATLAQRFDVDLFCGLFLASSNEGLSISPDILRQLGERGIEFSLDIYGPDVPPSV